MGKIFLLVGLAIVIFMAFSAYSVQKEIQGSAQLAFGAVKIAQFVVDSGELHQESRLTGNFRVSRRQSRARIAPATVKGDR